MLFCIVLFLHSFYSTIVLLPDVCVVMIEVLCVCSANTLMLEGVKRVWGKEGYIPQKEPSLTPAAVEEPSDVVQPPHQQGAPETSHPEPEPELPQLDQEKQQLASSLFVGLGSQNSTSLVSLLCKIYM